MCGRCTRPTTPPFSTCSACRDRDKEKRIRLRQLGCGFKSKHVNPQVAKMYATIRPLRGKISSQLYESIGKELTALIEGLPRASGSPRYHLVIPPGMDGEQIKALKATLVPE